MKAVRTIVAIGIGAALFFVLGRFASIPLPLNTYLSLQYAVLGVFSILFGPIAGILIGLIGHALIDLTSGYGLWWSWIIASGVVGLILGLFKKGVKIGDGKFSGKSMGIFVVANLVAHALSWIGVAPGLDILIYQEPVEKIFAQGMITASVNFLTGTIIGIILLFIYSKTFAAKGSLSKE